MITATTRRLRVARDDGNFDAFEVPAEAGPTLFDALRWIQLNGDPTLSLRHSCLHASCGTCGVRVNDREELACVCSLAELGDEITVEPLANLPTRTDLVADMRPFYDRLPARPPTRADGPFFRLEDCIECALCFSACPAVASGFAGPAAAVSRRADPFAWAAGPDGVWQCTTCKACVDLCPAGIAPMDTIVDLRRALVERGAMDPLLAKTLQRFAAQGNSQGKSARMRARWTRGLDFTIPDARKEPVEYLWFVGDFASFDERAVETTRTVARLLHDAGVSFGLLYEGERNAGNDVRKAGEEGLFELLREQNLRALAEADYEAIFTTDPHSLNALRNEYELEVPVYHYTELLADVMTFDAPLSDLRVTYHDPCYLARYNHVTDAPRRLIEATGATLVEMPRNGENTFCCGAGGGRIWMSDASGERPSEQRIREARATVGPLDYFLVSCPKDLVMYTDAAKVVGADFEVADLGTLLAQALTAAEV